MKVSVLNPKSNDFLQVNSPGIDGYGSNGVIGESGEPGNSIFYSAYDCVNNWERVKNRIDSNVEISDNNNYSSKNIDYNIGDIILDKTGTMYIYYSNTGENRLAPIRNMFNTSVFEQVNISSTIKDSSVYIKRLNPSYIGDYNNHTSSPYVYHRYKYLEYEYGNTLSVVISGTDNLNMQLYEFKAVLLLPNGRMVQKNLETGNTSINMFLPNRLFDGCDSKIRDNDGNFINIKIRNKVSYNGINSNDEIGAVPLYKSFILKTCKLYVEACDKVSGRIYRKYISINNG